MLTNKTVDAFRNTQTIKPAELKQLVHMLLSLFNYGRAAATTCGFPEQTIVFVKTRIDQYMPSNNVLRLLNRAGIINTALLTPSGLPTITETGVQMLQEEFGTWAVSLGEKNFKKWMNEYTKGVFAKKEG